MGGGISLAPVLEIKMDFKKRVKVAYLHVVKQECFQPSMTVHLE